MDETGRKLVDAFLVCEGKIKEAEQLLLVNYPLLDDGKILWRALEKIYATATELIALILKMEHIFGHISLGKDKGYNLALFFNKCSVKYGLSAKDCATLRKLLIQGKKLKESCYEFSDGKEAFMYNDKLQVSKINLLSLKSYFVVLHRLLFNTNKKLSFRKV